MEVERGGGRRAHRHGVLADQDQAREQHGDQADVLGYVQPPVEPEDQPDAAQVEADRLAGAACDPLGVLGLEEVGAYGVGPADRLQELLLLCPGRDPLARVERHGPAYVPACGPCLYGCREQCGEQEAPVEYGQGDQGQHDRQAGAGQLGQRGAHRLRHPGHIGGDPGGEVAGAGTFEAVGGQGQRPLHELLAHPGEYGLAQPGDQAHAQRCRGALGQCDGGDQGDGEGEVAGRHGARALRPLGHQVHDAAEQWLGQQSDGGRDDQDDARADGQEPVGAQELERGRAGAAARGDRQQVHRRGGRVRLAFVRRALEGLGVLDAGRDAHERTAVR